MQLTSAVVLCFASALLPAPAASVSLRNGLRKALAARSLSASGLPDPKCATGIVSLKDMDKPQACCPSYCGECSDYPTCASVRGQNSTFACCASQVVSMECGKGAPANVCLKKCTEALPPCIMPDGEVFTTPDPSLRNAGDDCNKAVSDWRDKAAAATSTTLPAAP
mmetsp:Transcript_106618/g.306732  ORF Transcript_106618/g.306732 Transcript_106618/m.306732 type:complete len:166 (-) Transcript_106618:1-498(-)